MKRFWLGLAAVAICGPAMAAETVAYTYDSRGQIKTVVHTGGPNNNLQVQYTHDASHNRTNKTVTGSPNG